MNWKRFCSQIAVLFFVSVVASATTWFVMTRQNAKEVSWKEMLNLMPEQEQRFSALESEFNLALKEISVQDAQNKITLCSYLHSGKMDESSISSTTKKMADLYEEKQKKIATVLASISSFLTPEQRKVFSNKLMHEVCASCRKSTGAEKCLCGMCDHSS